MAEIIHRTLVAQGPAGCRHLSRDLGIAPDRVGVGLHELAALGAVD